MRPFGTLGVSGLRVARLALLIITGLLFGGRAMAEDVCALSLDILFPDGSPARLQPVRLKDSSGKVVFEGHAENSKLNICDFGFGEHQLSVGYDRCYPITIAGLRFRLGQPIRLTIHLNECPPDVWGGSSCSLYFRVREPTGRRIEGVRVSLGIGSTLSITDGFGRAGSTLVGGTSAVATLSKEGYASEQVRLYCPHSEDIDKEVVLKPTR
jgi:hypothetical protein